MTDRRRGWGWWGDIEPQGRRGWWWGDGQKERGGGVTDRRRGGWWGDGQKERVVVG